MFFVEGVMPVKKEIHEIRDPIHSFIKVDSDERAIIDSRPFQRLRHIHQLAMTYLIYPGATHKRFEHSLGVMELATQIYDNITVSYKVDSEIKKLLPELISDDKINYWRKVLRLAALTHDLGHLPFSHAAEKELLPEGWDHELLTAEILRSEEIKQICESMTPPVRVADVIKLAIGPKKLPNIGFSSWELILSEIITGDVFGADRMDYLLRDSYHAGVAYGKFDHHRLIDTLRILPFKVDDLTVPSLGIEEGGLHTAESLLIARYFMYEQVYFHRVRRSYDIHLKDFLKNWLDKGLFEPKVEDILSITDNEVLAGIMEALRNKVSATKWAEIIVDRGHYRVLYERDPDVVKINPDAVEQIFKEISGKFGKENVRMDKYYEEGGIQEFPVLTQDSRVMPSSLLSSIIPNLPLVAVEYVFVAQEVLGEAGKWLEENKETIISLKGE